MTINRLVVNGDSYMEVYAAGDGHVDLAQRLGIEKSKSLAIGGSADTRVIRTCLKDSYLTQEPTLYVIGLGFLSRWEVPVLRGEFYDTFERRWTNPQNQDYKDKWEHHWNSSLTEKLVELRLKTDVYSIPDRLEDLMYRVMSMVGDLHHRGHRVVIYQQADSNYLEYIDRPEFFLYHNNPVFIDGLRWLAVPWQLKQGVKTSDYVENPDYYVPPDIRHPKPGEHHVLNEFLTNYIRDNNILA